MKRLVGTFIGLGALKRVVASPAPEPVGVHLLAHGNGHAVPEGGKEAAGMYADLLWAVMSLKDTTR